MGIAETHPDAVRDIDEIWVRIALDNYDAADRWVDRVKDAVARLADFPGMGQMRDDLGPGIRSWPLGDYLIFYEPIPGGVRILHVFHGARGYESEFRRR